MTSDPAWDVVHAAQDVQREIVAVRERGGVTVQESVSMTKLERAIITFLDEVGGA